MMHINQRRIKRREIRRGPEECAFKRPPGRINREPAQHYDNRNNLRPPGTRTGCLIRGLRSRGHDPSDPEKYLISSTQPESRTEHYSAIRESRVRDFIAPANGLAAPVIACGFGLRPRAWLRQLDITSVANYCPRDESPASKSLGTQILRPDLGPSGCVELPTA